MRGRIPALVACASALAMPELSASVHNLFDEDHGYPGAEDHMQDMIPQSVRALRLKATFRF